MVRAAVRPLLLALQGSPRTTGATARLLSAFLAPFAAWRPVVLNAYDLNVAPYRPDRHGPPDDMQRIFGYLDKACGLVVASPVYFYGFPSPLKAVIDRCQDIWGDPAWQQRPKRPAYLLSTCARTQAAEFSVLTREAKAFMNTVGFRLTESVLIPGMDEPDAAIRIRESLAQARALGRQAKGAMLGHD